MYSEEIKPSAAGIFREISTVNAADLFLGARLPIAYTIHRGSGVRTQITDRFNLLV
jgi:hypothetical protein